MAIPAACKTLCYEPQTTPIDILRKQIEENSGIWNMQLWWTSSELCESDVIALSRRYWLDLKKIYLEILVAKTYQKIVLYTRPWTSRDWALHLKLPRRKTYQLQSTDHSKTLKPVGGQLWLGNSYIQWKNGNLPDGGKRNIGETAHHASTPVLVKRHETPKWQRTNGNRSISCLPFQAK